LPTWPWPDVVTLQASSADTYRSPQWQIHPTIENYNNVPAWLRPTPRQCFVPHSPGLDYLPWPHVRDALMYVDPEAAASVLPTISLNWPYADSKCMWLDSATNKLILHPTFEARMQNLLNWTAAQSVVGVHPLLASVARYDQAR